LKSTRENTLVGALCFLALAPVVWPKVDWREVRQAVSHANLFAGARDLAITLAYVFRAARRGRAFALFPAVAQSLRRDNGGVWRGISIGANREVVRPVVLPMLDQNPAQPSFVTIMVERIYDMIAVFVCN
jgi:hypothetical protein